MVMCGWPSFADAPAATNTSALSAADNRHSKFRIMKVLPICDFAER
jgi:hypothetical protein